MNDLQNLYNSRTSCEKMLAQTALDLAMGKKLTEVLKQ